MSISPLPNVAERIQALTESLNRALPALDEIGNLQVSCQVATNLVEIKRDVRELADEARTLETLSQIAWVVSSELDLERTIQKVTDAATGLIGAAFGALFYNLPSADDGEAYKFYTLSGASRAEFAHFPLPRSTALLGPTLRGESVVRSDDITREERFGHNPPYRGMPIGHLPVRSYLAVPVISRTGSMLGALLFGHPSRGIFDERAEQLVLRIAAHAASAIDNARHHEAAQRLVLEQLHEVDRRKDEFLAVLAHELRNPLAPLRNGIEIVRQLIPNDTAVSRLTDMMGRQMVSLARLVDDLSDLSRVTHGMLELRRERVPLRTLVDTTLEVSRPLIEAHGHDLIVDCPDEQLAVDGDPQRLGQVLANLLSNSAKYTPRGGRITLTAARVGADAAISVVDTGVGIPPESLGSVFELFSQIQAPGQSEGGLGIGLALVRRLVHLHGGVVTAHSDGVGTGSRFTVRLPALSSIESGSETPGATASPKVAHVARQRILVADDNTDAADSLSLWLQLAGHDVRTVADGQQVVAVAEEFRPEVIFMDLGMPQLDGLAASRKIRAKPWGRSIRIIALTGWGRTEDRLRSQAAGIDVHWVKPVDLHTVMSLLATSR